MTFREAAKAVLVAAGRPLTTTEVADAAIAAKLVSLGGKTPGASMSAALYSLLASGLNTGLRRLAIEGPRRAERGSVRWEWLE